MAKPARRRIAAGVPRFCPRNVDVVRVVDRHEVVGGDVEPLERQEIERAIPLQRTAKRGAVLLLRVRGLLAIDGLSRRIEALEVILRIQRSRRARKKNRLPPIVFVPLLVTMLTTPPDALPNSAEYELVST